MKGELKTRETNKQTRIERFIHMKTNHYKKLDEPKRKREIYPYEVNHHKKHQ